jgi:uncharacterized membrane protein YphA (DoxX/SURF4 family)
VAPLATGLRPGRTVGRNLHVVIGVVAAVLIGAVFLVSGVAKLARPALWSAQATELGTPRPIISVLPYVELVLGALLVAQVGRRAVASAGVAVFAAFTAMLLVRIRQGRRPPCACFGSLSTRPIGWLDVARNTCLIAIALTAAFAP